MRVVLVESRDRIRQDLLEMFGQRQIDARHAQNSQELTALLDDGTVAVIVIGEPEEQSKSKLIRTVRQHPRAARVAVVAIVDEIDGPEGHKLLQTGADDLLTLPVTAEDLRQAVQRAYWENAREIESGERERRLVKSANLLVEFFSQLNDGYFVATDLGEIIAASSGLARLTGFEQEELVGETIAGLGLTLTADFSVGDDSTEPRRLSFTLLTSDWRNLDVIAELSEIRLAGGRCLFGVVREEIVLEGVPPRHAWNAIETVVRNASDPLLIVDRSGLIQQVSIGFERSMGWGLDAMKSRPVVDFVAPEDYTVVQPFGSRGIHSGDIEGVSLLQEDGEYRTVNLAITELDQDPLLTGWLVTVSAPSNSILHQTRRLAGGGFYTLYDPVTALPNRLLFIDRLDHAIERNSQADRVIACYVVSVDDAEKRFASQSSDTVNHLFCEYGKRLHQTVPEGDTIARVGDADFAVLAEQVDGIAEARVLGDRIIDALHEPYETATGTVALRSSAGVTVGAPSGQNAGDLLRDAAAAMEHSRNLGGSRCTLFENRMRRSVVDGLKIEGDINGMHRRGELQVFFQPEVDLHSERLLAAEALVRWEHPRHGLILPGEFLALAEESGFLNDMGLWIIEKVCETVQGWRSRHPAAGTMVGVVNLTAGQIRARGFSQNVASILDASGLPHENLRLEVSAGQVPKIERWAEIAGELHSLGVKIGLQDVNPATVSKSKPDPYPVDVYKIDRTMMGTPLGAENPPKARLMAEIGQDRDVPVIVSSIETAHHLARARILGYTAGQGYYFYRPAPAQTIAYLLARGSDASFTPECE